MIAHVVSFSWAPGTTEADVAAVATAFDALAEEIPVVRGVLHGRDIAWREGNADYAFVAILDTDDPRDFLQHPAHQRVLTELVAPRIASRSSVQLRLDHPARITRD